MLGWQIFAHSVRMVFGNLKQVLQITVGPALLATIVVVGLVLAMGVPLAAFDENASDLPPGVSPGSFIFLVLVLMIVVSVVMFWIAVSWHRFILLEEYPSGIFPTFRFDRILAYFGRGLLLGLLMIVAYIPLMIIFLGLAGNMALVAVIVAVLYVLFMIVCFYRLTVILPAAAIGKPVSLGEAWASTKGTAGSILILLIVAALFQIVVQLIFALLAFIPVLGVLLTVFFGILVLPMINVSIFTTMYGVFIEKRSLD